MARLLVVTHSLRGDGAARTLAALLLHLAALPGWRVDVIHPGAELLCEPLARAGVRFVNEVQSSAYDLALIWSFMNLRAIPDVARYLPVVVVSHEGAMFLRNCPDPPQRMAQLLAMARRVVFVNRWQRDVVFGLLVDKLPAGRVAVIPNGWPPAETQSHQTGPLPDEVSGQMPGCAPGGVAPKLPGVQRIVCVGVIQPRKRQLDLVQAVRPLGRRNTELVLVGDNTTLERMPPHFREAFAAAPFAHLTGEVAPATVRAWLASADVFCLPSEDEVEPLSIFEAAAAGVPMLLSDLPTYQGLWAHERHALMVPVGDLTALAAGLARLLDDRALAGGLAREAAARVAERPIKAFLQAWTDLLLEAAR